MLTRPPTNRHKPGCKGGPETVVTFSAHDGTPLENCRKCGSTWAERPQDEQRKPAGRFSMLCVTCGYEFRFNSPRPRTPLCRHCQTKRQKAKRRTEQENTTHATES